MAGHGCRTGQALLLVVLMLGMAATPFLSADEREILLPSINPQESIIVQQNFTNSQGFTLSNLSLDSGTGLTTLTRPPMSWTATSGLGLTSLRTGACSAYIPSTNEVFLVGGRVDVDPSQTGDETSTKMVEVYDVANRTWEPSTVEMQQRQQYHGCAVVANKIYAIGDHYPFASPTIQATGLVQVYNPANNNWSYGTSMPANRSVGLAGVTAHNGMIYVAGGVSAHDRSDSTDRLMRYDVANDTWSQMANMNNRRHSFDLVSFRGKLIAYGGVAEFFDPAANTTVEEETNLTEAYDPITDTWSQLPNATHAMSAYAAEVFNDEIVIHGGYEVSGWQGTANDKTYGYDPFTNRWDTYATLQIGMYDSTLVRANNSLVYASGDSSNTRFSTWSIQYLAENEYHLNPSQQSGMLTSSVQDMRTTTHSAASFLWLDFATIEPSGTSIGLQYRTAQSLQSMTSAAWLPTTVPVNTYLPASNNSLDASIEDAPFLQYRVRYSTTELMDWITPTLVDVSIGADSAGFVSQLPSTMQPTSSPITITTQHHGPTADGTYTLQFHPSNSFGSLSPNTNWTRLVWDTATQALSVVDEDNLLFGQPTATVGTVTSQGQTVNWTFALAGSMVSDHLRFRTTTHAERNVTYFHPDIVEVDRSVTIEITNITADASSTGDSTVEEGEVLPGNTQLDIAIDHFFTNSGLRLLGGSLQARLHLDMETYNEDVFGDRIWSNESSEWFDLPSGQLFNALLNVPEDLSGEMHLWFEARTSEDWDLVYSTDPHPFIINADGPTLLALTPPLDAYLNEQPYRTVTFEFYDVGGFTNETVTAFTWLEARDDGTNGAAADGVPQREEYQPAVAYFSQQGNRWFVNVTVNDTVNDDHQWARVLLEGTDIAGFALPSATAEDGHARWESRTPIKGQLVSFSPTKNLLTETLMRFEPAQEVGWSLEVEDPNGLDDIMEVRLELGNDASLGIKYTVLDNTCESLDERLLLIPTGCVVNTNNGNLNLDITATVQWSFVEAGLIQGEVDIYVRDYDGMQHYDYSEGWVLERAMTIAINSFTDDDGVVTQPVGDGAVVMAGDGLNLTAEVHHLTSATPYTGELRLRWDGMIQSDEWKGGMAVTIENGQFVATIPTPELSGLIYDLTLTLWDPLQVEQLASYDVTPFRIDHVAPALLPSSISDTISRYHLDAVQVGVNIDEAEGWSSPLQLTCQVRSMAVEWDTVTLVRNATTVFNGNTMFSFTFDFSELGDPSLLSPQASLACWAEGIDDAGWSLTSETGNSALDPWLEAPLNNIGPDLALDKVEFNTDVKAGEKISLSFFVVNGGEGLSTPFNATIELVQGDERTLVGRSIFNSMDENTAKSVRRSFEAPEGKWTLEITVDLEQNIWEIDETNNVFSQTITTEGGGLSALVLASAGGVMALLGAVVLLKRRSPPILDETALAQAIKEVPETPNTPPSQPTEKRKGPPGGKIAGKGEVKPARGPPRAPPKGPPQAAQANTEISPQAMAAAHMDALGVPKPQEAPASEQPQTHAEDYSKLPGGGEYEYTADATYYVGETCGRWILNEDKSFTLLPDENEGLPS